jgi:hypothetical protein
LSLFEERAKVKLLRSQLVEKGDENANTLQQAKKL